MSPKTYILEESLGYHVGRTSRTLGALFNRNLAAAGYDVTCEQWSIMVNLVANNGQNQMDLAALTCKDKTSITRLINGMEKHNLVTRIPDKDDKRNKLIYLTKKGRDLYQDLLKVVSQTLEQAEKGLETKDLQLCKKTLTAIYNNIVAATTNKKAKGRL